MKKLLLTFALISVLFSKAQDGYSLDETTYQSIYDQINLMDSISTKSFADTITKKAAVDYNFIKVKASDNGNTLIYYYLNDDLTGDDKTEALEFGCQSCFRVYFKAHKDGFKFSSVIGTLEDLLPTWSTIFLTSASEENINSSFKYREVKNRAIGLDVRFNRRQHLWQIYNWSL